MTVTVTLTVLAAVLLLGLVLANKAAALPGDTPITAVGPADGANVPAVEEGLKVTYTCPVYRTVEELVEEEIPLPPKEVIPPEEEELPPPEEEELPEEEVEVIEKLVPVFGNSENYGVIFSTGSALGTNGRLVSTGFGEAGEAEAEVVKGTPSCTSELELPTSPNPAVLYQGRVYWQAFRECEGCPSGFETGPVQSFVVVPTIEEAEITYENHVFAGYMTKVSFFASASLKGAKVALQRWTGTEWLTLSEEPGTESGENSFFITLGAGHRLLRPVLVGTGVTLPLEEKAKTIRRVRKGTARIPIQTGNYAYALKSQREEFPLSFRVTQGGTMLTGFRAAVEAVCRGPNKEKVTREAASSVRSVPIAPNGDVVAHFATTGATPSTVTLTGSFFSGRFTGLLTSSFLNCSGFREFEAVPVAPTKK